MHLIYVNFTSLHIILQKYLYNFSSLDILPQQVHAKRDRERERERTWMEEGVWEISGASWSELEE